MKTIIYLMAIYNSEKYVSQSIESIIRSFNYAKQHDAEIQSYLIIRNDGSTDKSICKITEQIEKNNNIYVLNNRTNVGILKTRTLLLLDACNFINEKGIKNKESIFLSFMDSDDICTDNRVLYQLREMVSDQTLKACGGQALCFNNDPINSYCPYGFLTEYKLNYDEVKVESIFQSSTLSSNISFRYDWIKWRIENLHHSKIWASWRIGEDWSFIVESMIAKDFKYKNMSDVLIYYRKHESSMTSTVTDGIGTDQYYIRNISLSYIGLELTDEEHRLLITISPCRHWSIYNVDFFHKNQTKIYQMSETLIDKILSANKTSKFYNQDYLEYYTSKILLNVKNHEEIEYKNTKIILNVI